MAKERAVSEGLALGTLFQGKAHTQTIEHRQRLLQPGNNTVHGWIQLLAVVQVSQGEIRCGNLFPGSH